MNKWTSVIIVAISIIVAAITIVAVVTSDIRTTPAGIEILPAQAPEATPGADAQIIKTCAGVDVRSIDVSRGAVQNIPLDVKQETIEPGLSTPETKDITVVARGPILASMDSAKIETQLSCTAAGLTVVATILRSEYYNGITTKNQLWQPTIRVAIAPYPSEIVFQTVWKMRLTNGKDVDRARTPPYPEQNYPITVTKIVHSTSGQQ